jgi:hypothetical protein
MVLFETVKLVGPVATVHRLPVFKVSPLDITAMPSRNPEMVLPEIV